MMRLLRSRDPRMLRWGRLGLWALAVAGVWGLLQLFDSTPRQDAWLLLSISIVYWLGVGVMLRGTEEWTLRNLGLLSTITGEALLYGLGALAALKWIDPASDREIDLIRTFLLIGGAALLVALLGWTWVRGVSRRGRIIAIITTAAVLSALTAVTLALIW